MIHVTWRLYYTVFVHCTRNIGRHMICVYVFNGLVKILVLGCLCCPFERLDLTLDRP